MGDKLKLTPRWYFGGLASGIAACFTHPLDLIKVQQQTQQQKMSPIALGMKILRNDGILGLYNGLSASFLRQLTYSMTRFAMYGVGKDLVDTKSMTSKSILAGFSGFVGGLIGSPADKVNVRMQNDMKLPPAERRNYKHCFDGLFRVYKTEGVKFLFSGALTAASRGALITIGQIAFYEQIKDILTSYNFPDNTGTHLISSVGAAMSATCLSQPLDVIKTRAMNAKKGEYTGIMHIITDIAKAGPGGFFKGFLPAFVRLGPHTVCLFLTLEQLRIHFGIPPKTTL